MMAGWEKLVARVNAMKRRERLLLFAAIVILLGAVTNQLFIAPLTRLQAQRAREIDSNTEALEAQRAKLEQALAGSRRARVAELEAQIAATQSEIEAADRAIAAISASATDEAALRAVLTRSLQGTRKVALLRVSTADGAAAGGAPAAGRGVDITLGGDYLDLMEYLAALEAALPQARWSALRLTAETTPVQLSVRIATPRDPR
jgi:MSHA biogenesis protein MshJ